jgi:hypothetical protein
VRSDDQARPHDRVALAEGLGYCLLAERLQRPVVRVVLEHPVLGHVAELRQLAVLVVDGGQAGVDRDARDEQVASGGVRQQFGRGPDDPGQETRRVEHRVPLAAAQFAEVGRTVPAELFDLRKELRVRLAPVEQRHVVTARERFLDGRPPEELRPAEDQQPHAAG